MIKTCDVAKAASLDDILEDYFSLE